MSSTKAQTVSTDFQFLNRLIRHFAGDSTHEESAWQLPFEHNCLNWIVGHMVANRSHVLEAVGIEHGWQDEIRARYHQDTPPVTAADDGIDLNILYGYLDESLELLAKLAE